MSANQVAEIGKVGRVPRVASLSKPKASGTVTNATVARRAARANNASSNKLQETSRKPVRDTTIEMMWREREVLGLLRTKNGQCHFSPDGTMCAFAAGNHIIVCLVPLDPLQPVEVLSRFSALDTIDLLEWSSDSVLLLAAQFQRAVVQVFNATDKSWVCKANEGVAGLVGAMFVPDGRQFITIADFQLHITVWNTRDQSQHCIESPKLQGPAGCRFTDDGQFVAVLHRRECKDSIGVYSTNDWSQISHFGISSSDAEEIVWSPGSDSILVRETAIEYLVLVYNPLTGDLLGRYSAYNNALGVKSVTWSPDGNFVAVGSFDSMCRILGSVSWKPVMEIEFPSVMTSTARNFVITEKPQVIEQTAATQKNSFAVASDENRQSRLNNGTTESDQSKESGESTLHKFNLVKADPKKALPKTGPVLVAWSLDSQFLAIREDEKPSVLWIWKVSQVEPYTVIEFHNKVASFKWDPTRPRLAVATGETFSYVWCAYGPNSFTIDKATPRRTLVTDSMNGSSWSDPVLGVRWSPNGDALALVSKTKACFAQIPELPV